MMKNAMKKILFVMLLASSALIAGCNGNVGIGLNVGVPIGNHGYMSVGTSRWL
jgi:predicted small secreted protein